MFHDYTQIRESLKCKKPPIISVAVAQDREVIETIKAVCEEGWAEAVFVGDKERIERILGEEEISSPAPIIHEADEEAACQRAVQLVKCGEAGLLMKGLVNSSVFLRAVLQGEKATDGGGFLSHLAAFQVPSFHRLLFFSDGGMNIAPDLEGKKRIILNAVEALHRLRVAFPRVAVLTANEKVDQKMLATVDAAALSDMWNKGEIPGCLLEGPITMDS